MWHIGQLDGYQNARCYIKQLGGRIQWYYCLAPELLVHVSNFQIIAYKTTGQIITAIAGAYKAKIISICHNKVFVRLLYNQHNPYAVFVFGSHIPAQQIIEKQQVYIIGHLKPHNIGIAYDWMEAI